MRSLTAALQLGAANAIAVPPNASCNEGLKYVARGGSS
jgi:hypothetical protein